MWLLIAGEIGGFAILFAGVVIASKRASGFRHIEFLARAHAIKNIAHRIHRHIFEIDAFGLDFTGVKRQLTVVQTAREGDRNVTHDSPCKFKAKHFTPGAPHTRLLRRTLCARLIRWPLRPRLFCGTATPVLEIH